MYAYAMLIIYIKEESYATEIGKVMMEIVKKYHLIRSIRSWTSTFCQISNHQTKLFSSIIFFINEK